MPKFTDASIRSLPLPAKGQVTYSDEGSALKLRVSQGGAKTFFVTLDGSGDKHTLGRYGDVTLAEARAAARRLRAEKTLGRILPRSVSLADARKEYLAGLTVRPNTNAYYARNLGRLKGPKLTDIASQTINRILDTLGESSRLQALRTYTAFFNWCLRRHYLERSPCALMQGGQSKSRARVLKDEELKHIWVNTEELTTYHRIVRLLMLCGQRPRETAASRASWIDENGVTIPSEIAKNKREHLYPVGRIAIQLFLVDSIDADTRDTSNDRLLFPARGKQTPFNGWSKSKKALDRKLNGYVAPWQLRDLRRTYRTLHARIGTPPHIAERLINHVSSTSEVEKIYDRYKYLPEMKSAVLKFEEFFLNIVART
jgi:integrase